jgi:hypothetical protein
MNSESSTSVTYLCDQKIFTIDDFLSEEDSVILVKRAETKGFNNSSPSGGGHGRTGREDPRTSQFCVIDDLNYANNLWNKIYGYLPPDVSHVSTTGYISNDQIATEWKPVGINPHLRIYKYDVGQVFPEHVDYKMCRKVFRDGKEFRQMTFMTLLVYLNDDFTGGQTGFWTQHDTIGMKEHCRFLRASEHKPHQVVVNPKIGMALVNDQNLLHEGMAPTKGTKYVLRTDIVHERHMQLHDKLLKSLPENYFETREEPWERLFETSCKNYAD